MDVLINTLTFGGAAVLSVLLFFIITGDDQE